MSRSLPRRFSGRARPHCLLGLLPAVLLLAGAASAGVEVVGVSPGSSATLVIDGAPPVTVDVGQTVSGVTVLGANTDSAEVRVRGSVRRLPLVPYRGGTSSIGTAASVTLTADASGHFFANGLVEGEPVHFLVDTGASSVSLSRSMADGLGLHYESGQVAFARTANGVVRGWKLSLDSVQVGNLELRDVEAMVVDGDALHIALLGMSFLNRLDMERSGATLVLRRR